MTGSTPQEAENFVPAESALKRGAFGDPPWEAGRHDGLGQQHKKGRKSVGRRVSFAPDSQLETMHLYPKDGTPDQNSNPNTFQANLEKSSIFTYEPKAWLLDTKLSPIMTSSEVQESPGGSTMELTGPADNHFAGRGRAGEDTHDVQISMEDACADDEGLQQAEQRPALLETISVEGGVPSLGCLLEEDEAQDVDTAECQPKGLEGPAESAGPVAEAADVSMDLTEQGNYGGIDNTTNHSIGGYTNMLKTGLHPSWGGMAEPVMAAAEEPAVSNTVTQKQAEDGSNQINKWGFAPGEDDTQDLNLEFKGRLMMGDNTYNHIFGSNNTNGEVPPPGLPSPRQEPHSGRLDPADLDVLFRRADSASNVLRSAIKENLDSPGSASKGRRSSIGLGSARSLTGHRFEEGEPTATPRPFERRISQALQDAWVQDSGGRLSAAPSERSIRAQREGPSQFIDSPHNSLNTPPGVTPMSRFGTATLPDSVLARGSSMIKQPATGDLLSGEPYLGNRASPLQQTPAPQPSGTLQERMTISDETPQPRGSIEKPLIDLGTPKGQGSVQRLQGGSTLGKHARASDNSPLSLSKRRFSVVSAMNDLTGKLLQDEGSAPLPSMGQAHNQNHRTPGSANGPLTGKDMTTRLLLEESIEVRQLSQGSQMGDLPGPAMELRAFAVASAAPHNKPALAIPDEKTMGTTRLLADSTDGSREGTAHEVGGGGAPVADGSNEEAATGDPGERGDDDSTMNLDLGGSPQLLTDVTTGELEAPPELVPGWEDRYRATVAANSAGLRTPSMFPGGALLQRTPPPSTRNRKVPPRFASPEAIMTRSCTKLSPARDVASPEVHTGGLQTAAGGLKPTRTPTRMGASGTSISSPRRSTQKPITTPKPPLHPNTVSASKGVMTRSATRAAGTPPASMGRGKHRLATASPLLQQPEPLSLHEFLREVDIQFLDHLRRGASINLADLASDPPPHTLQDCYKLMCLTAPEIAQYEEGIRTLQSETAARKATTKEKEDELANQQLLIFVQMQIAGVEDQEAIKKGAQDLKKLCRLRATLSWKEWRATMEAQKNASLLSKLQLLQHDRSFLQSNLKNLSEVGRKVADYAQATRKAAVDAADQHAAEVARRQALLVSRTRLEQQKQANELRLVKKAELDSLLNDLKEKHAIMRAERAQLHRQLAQQKTEVEESQRAAQAMAERSVTAEALLAKIENLDRLTGLQCWQLETAAPQGSELTLRFGELFRLNIFFQRNEDSSSAAQAYLDLVGPDEGKVKSAALRMLAADLARNPESSEGGVLDRFALRRVTAPMLASKIHTLSTKIGRISDLLSELEGLRLDFPTLSEIAPQEGGALRLSVLDLGTETKFSVVLQLELAAGLLEAGPVKVHFPGENKVTAEAIRSAVSTVPGGSGCIRAVCEALTQLPKTASTAQQETASLDSTTHTGGELRQDLTAPNLDEQARPQESPRSEAVLDEPMTDAVIDETLRDAVDEPGPESETEAGLQADTAVLSFNNPLFNNATPARPVL